MAAPFLLAAVNQFAPDLRRSVEKRMAASKSGHSQSELIRGRATPSRSTYGNSEGGKSTTQKGQRAPPSGTAFEVRVMMNESLSAARNSGHVESNLKISVRVRIIELGQQTAASPARGLDCDQPPLALAFFSAASRTIELR
jgi:hypothetical protein